MTTDEIVAVLERIAPRGLAESWDNPGWQVRVPSATVTGILLAVDATPVILEETARLGCNLLFTHHPTIFKPIGSLDLGTPRGMVLAEAVRHDISIWSAHTNLDVMPDGTSLAMAKAVGLRDTEVLSRSGGKDYKLAVYVPASHADAVKSAMAAAGAGTIGNYSSCFWQTLGVGQFMAGEGADPYLGKVGEVERVDEYRVEAVVAHVQLGAVLEAMRKAHPYEEVAYDVVPLSNQQSSLTSRCGYGAIGVVDSPVSTGDFARHAASVLSSAVCQVAGRSERMHGRVAVMGGSGSTFIEDAIRKGATLFVTADVRYHDAQDAVAKGLDLVILDHFATERPVLDLVRAKLIGLLPDVPVHLASVPSTPYVRVES